MVAEEDHNLGVIYLVLYCRNVSKNLANLKELPSFCSYVILVFFLFVHCSMFAVLSTVSFATSNSK